MKKVSIDFGTTNTVVAVWREANQAPETVRLPGLSSVADGSAPPLIPSLVYIRNGATPDVIVGQSVRAEGLDVHSDPRYFSSFKRGIAASTRPLKRQIDDTDWDEPAAGDAFLSRVLACFVEQEGQIDELVLTVPVQSFERYLKWLRDETALADRNDKLGIQRLRIVD